MTAPEPAPRTMPPQAVLQEPLGEDDDVDVIETWPGPLTRGQVVALPGKCWRCGGATNRIVGILVWQPGSHAPGFIPFEDCSEMLAVQVPPASLLQHGVGILRLRSSRIGGTYISNGCPKCDAIQGNFPLSEELLEFELGGGRVANLPRVAEVELTPPLVISGMGYEDFGYTLLHLGGSGLDAELRARWSLVSGALPNRWTRPVDDGDAGPPIRTQDSHGVMAAVSSEASSTIASSSAPACPRCGQPMTMRVAQKGRHAGGRFWGCTTYPRCKAILPLD